VSHHRRHQLIIVIIAISISTQQRHEWWPRVQANLACLGNRSSIVAAGVDGLLLASEAAMNAGPSPACADPLSTGCDPAGVPLLLSGTDPRTWTAKDVVVSTPAGYVKNNVIRLYRDCPGCVDVVLAASLVHQGEPSRDYGAPARNQSLWARLARRMVASWWPMVAQLAAAESFEQQPTFAWAMPAGAGAFDEARATMGRLGEALHPCLPGPAG
jgi:hypothetical protein